MADLRIGIIGFGKMGMLHGGIVNGLEGSTLAAVAEPSDLVARALKTLKPDVRVYSDYREMLKKEDLDAAYIATPVFQHVDMGIACVEHGVSTFVEKPLSTTASEARRLVDALERRSVPNMVAWMMRYLPTFRRAKSLLESGVLGKVIQFQVTMYVSQLFRKGKGWRYDKKKSGGGLIMGPCSHALDLVTWYFGEAAFVNARQNNFYSGETEDFLHVIFEMKSGVTGWLDSSWSVRGHRLVETRFDVHGTDGTLIVTDDIVKVFLEKEAAGLSRGWTIERIPELFEGVPIDIGGGQYTRENIEFLRCVREGRSPENNVRAAWKVHRLIDAIYASAADRGAPKEPDAFGGER
ncbi:MAG: gfo/Idh/MocA family oxidoreductase [Candidatus Hydrogenedentota bacterium]|nr:MAG: gfo/Idh/MocA family oxidoreductase [Candidatus Hydrogenedentota bacterium]